MHLYRCCTWERTVLVSNDRRKNYVRRSVGSQCSERGLKQVSPVMHRNCTDFDWGAGMRGKFHRYSLMLSSEIPWPAGVEALSAMKMRHDEEMLERLFLCLWPFAHHFVSILSVGRKSPKISSLKSATAGILTFSPEKHGDVNVPTSCLSGSLDQDWIRIAPGMHYIKRVNVKLVLDPASNPILNLSWYGQVWTS